MVKWSESTRWSFCQLERRTPLYLVRLLYDQPKPDPRDSGKWFGTDPITSPPFIIVAPKALKSPYLQGYPC